MPVVYALLCGELIYVAILAFFGRRIMFDHLTMGLGSLSLALAFGMLALVTADVFQHGQYPFVTRAGFIGYGLSLGVIILRYWRNAWKARSDGR